MNWPLTGEISIGIVVGMWAAAYAIAGVRRYLHGPDILETVNDAFYLKYSQQAAKHAWPYRILTALDIFLNVITRGQADETLSSRSWRASLEGKIWGCVLNHWLSLIQVQHGPKAAVGDVWRGLERARINKSALGLK